MTMIIPKVQIREIQYSNNTSRFHPEKWQGGNLFRKAGWVRIYQNSECSTGWESLELAKIALDSYVKSINTPYQIGVHIHNIKL